MIRDVILTITNNKIKNYANNYCTNIKCECLCINTILIRCFFYYYHNLTWSQAHTKALEFSKKSDLILICGRYEGFDERIREKVATEEISIGDFILSGGEIAAMSVIDAVSRLVPDVLGSKESSENDSFSDGLLQFPQYTRPASFRGMQVPSVLLSGNHSKIRKCRRIQSLLKTLKTRPDLLKNIRLTTEEQSMITENSPESNLDES